MLNFLYTKTLSLLKRGKISKGGRNFLGRVCFVGRSFLKKKRYIKIDFFRRINQFGFLFKLIYDLNRTRRVGQVIYQNGIISCIVLSESLKMGNIIYSGSKINLLNTQIKIGDALPLKFMNLLSLLNCIELKPFKGAQLMRSSGANCILIGKTLKQGILKLKSGWQVKVSLDCMSTVGVVSERHRISIGKAGKHRELGFRPKVRGVAKNPCDHPHGGGNGKRSKPKIPVNSYGTVFKWKPTTNTKKDRLKRRLFKSLSENSKKCKK